MIRNRFDWFGQILGSRPALLPFWIFEHVSGQCLISVLVLLQSITVRTPFGPHTLRNVPIHARHDHMLMDSLRLVPSLSIVILDHIDILDLGHPVFSAIILDSPDIILDVSFGLIQIRSFSGIGHMACDILIRKICIDLPDQSLLRILLVQSFLRQRCSVF